MVVDNITLEDFVKYQQVDCEIIRGYKWTDPKDFSIQQVIRNVFNKRLEHKKNGNPLQEVYKLIMNSAYGKTIQKPIKDKSVYKKFKTIIKKKGKGEVTDYPLNKLINLILQSCQQDQ